MKKYYSWIPSLYLMEALPYSLVTGVSPIFYKSFNLTNERIAFYTSLFTIPWLLKPALAPMLETLASKRTFTVVTELLLAALFFLLAFSLHLPNFFYITAIIFFAIAITSTIHDMNADGLYIISLDAKAQTHFIGIRTLFYRIGVLICQGGLVYLAGFLVLHVSQKLSWHIVLTLLAGITLLIALYHKKMLPTAENKMDDTSVTKRGTLNSFRAVFVDLVNSGNVIGKIIFVVFYNFAEAQLIKIVPLFLMDKIKHGGLGLSIENVGLLYGGLGVIGMLFGIVLSGLILTKISLKKCLVPVTIFVSVANIGFLLLSMGSYQSIVLIGCIISFAQFAYGLSNGAYMLYLVRCFSSGKYPMSLYAIGTALMGSGVTLGGMSSGYMQQLLGYTHFFYWILLAGAGIVLISIYNSNRVLKEV